MQRFVALAIVLGFIAVSGSITQVRADCDFHKSQAALEKTTTSKEVATVTPVDKTVTGQLRTAQSDEQSKPAPQVKN